MASWKKVIVSGSNISQLTNDSGYLIVTDTIDSASVAAVATTLSPEATASIADRATTASFADLAGNARSADSASVAARATTLSTDATASFALVAGTARNADSASVAARATELSADATASFADLASSARSADSASVADNATTASFAANGDGVFSGSFSGSFEGDGAGLTGIATTLTIDADSGGTSTVDLKTQTLDIAGTSNEIATSVSGQTITISLPNDVTIGQDLTVSRDATITRNLTVLGTASFQNTTDLDVADRFIRLASGSNANGDGGIVIQQDSQTNGEAFAFDSATSRWGVTGSFDPTDNVIVPDAFMATVVEGAADDPTAAPARYTKKGNTFVANNGDIYIYS